jgi:hypothetical protein
MKPPVYYFPTKVGTKLEYEDEAKLTRTLVVTAVAERGGAKIVSLGRIASDESVSPHSTLAVTGTGLYRVEHNGHKFLVPESWLLLPAEFDRKWEYSEDGSTEPRSIVHQRIVGTKDVTVPAGTFRCVGVNSYQNGLSVVCWYAVGVGIVKSEAAKWGEVLKSFTPGKD